MIFLAVIRVFLSYGAVSEKSKWLATLVVSMLDPLL